MEKKELTSDKQLKYISDAIYLEEASNIQLIMRGLVTVAALLLALIIWAAFAKITETTSTFGQLIPEGEIQTVQHLEGGIVAKLLVKEGDNVKKDQVVIQLRTTELEAELQELQSNEASLLLESLRLKAFLQNKNADPKVWAKELLASKYNEVKPSEVKDLIGNQIYLLQSQYNELKQKEEGLQDNLAQHKEELNELMNKKKIWQTHIKLLTEEFKMYEGLKSKQYISSRDYLTIMREMNQAQGEGATLDSRAAQAKEAIGETQNKLEELAATARKDAYTQLTKDESELLALRFKISRAREQIARSAIKAPISGTVKGITVYPGNVAKPATVLMEIVPEGDKLIAESRIQPQDIGYIRVGAPVKVKVVTYDYARFGTINGKVYNISASTFLDDKGNPFYKAKIALDQQYLGSNAHKKALKAGMTIQADIITGSKTLLEYLLKPIQRSVTDSFRER